MPITILSLHAHPDDEASKGAATVAKLVDAGATAVLVTATGGEAGDILNPEMDVPGVADRLPEIRRSELAASAAIIGYDSVIELGYRDSGMPGSEDNARPDAFCNQPLDDVLERLVRIVREVRPDVVFGYDAHEFYPHPDHLRVHALSTKLVAAAGDPDRFVDSGEPWHVREVYAPVFSRRRLTSLHEAMLAEYGESPFVGWLDRMDEVAQGQIEERGPLRSVRVSGFIERGREALRAHRTQVDPNGFWFAVPTDLVEQVYPWEDFEVLHHAVPKDGSLIGAIPTADV